MKVRLKRGPRKREEKKMRGLRRGIKNYNIGRHTFLNLEGHAGQIMAGGPKRFCSGASRFDPVHVIVDLE